MLLFPEDLAEASLRCLHFVEHGEETKAIEELTTGVVRVGEIDGGETLDETAVLAHIASVLGFPSYFSGSFSGLTDCLSDERVGPTGFVLVVRNASWFWRTAPVVAGMLVEAWIAAVDTRRTVPLHLVFVWNDRMASLLPPGV